MTEEDRVQPGPTRGATPSGDEAAEHEARPMTENARETRQGDERPRIERVERDLEPGSPGPGSVGFTFNGRRLQGREGDTVGAALLANGVEVIGRSFKYHRPRGMLCAAGRCPNCLVDIDGTPSVRACSTQLSEGMQVRTQNAWPSLRFDLMSIMDRLDHLLPVGFYYKTFIRPRALWPLYERVLRGAAGLGRIDPLGRPDLHPRKRHVFADVAVVGGGPAGCLAALEAAAAGARVILIDDQSTLGGRLRLRTRAVSGSDPRLAGLAGVDAARRLAELVAAEARIEHLADATAIGLYEGRLLGVNRGDELVRVRASEVVVATGSQEHPLLFRDNDRPGVMLADGILRLIHLSGVRPGDRAVVLTDDDHGWRQATELIAAGIRVTAIVDTRPAAAGANDRGGEAAETLRAAGVEAILGATPVGVLGRTRAEGLRIASAGSTRDLDADMVAVAARPAPVVSLLAQEGSRPRYDDRIGDFVPGELPEWLHAAGSLRGLDDDALVLDGGAITGRIAGLRAQSRTTDGDSKRLDEHHRSEAEARAARPEPAPFAYAKGGRQFVCVCEDITTRELAQGAAEGFGSLELMKRYSTVTMGPCQGKMCHALASQVQARLARTTPAEAGLTTSRPPFQPVSLAALAGPHLARVRRTAMHERHAALGATWTDMGDWKRPLHYGDIAAECRAVHEAAGLIDVSTLGKLDVQGADAGAFLDWLHPNRFSDLREGRVRYRAMLDDAGIILDDGTVARLGAERFFLSTTTGNLDAVEQWLGWWLADGRRRVSVTDVTGHYAAVNLAGPRSREIMRRVTSLDVSREAMPYLAAAEGDVAGIPAIILRIGFVGELGYEIHVPADYGTALWDALMDAGGDLGLRAFGVEAQRVLRLEKQHAIIGQDTDALSNPIEAGLGWLVKADKPDFIGRDATAAVASRPTRQVLTGFEILEGGIPAEGAAIVSDGTAIGRVTSCKWSPTLERAIGMAWLAPEAVEDGRPIRVRLGVGRDGTTAVGVVRTRPFYDPAGERLRS